MGRLFGTDGIRGVANSENMTIEIAVAVGRAAAYFVRNSSELPQIVIGKDTRLSGYMIEESLTSGIISMGLNVMKTGPLPTPGIAFICRSMRARLGIIVSASHNRAIENGIKLFNQDGYKLSREEEEEIEEIIFSKEAERHLAPPDKIGKVTQVHDAAGRYIQFLKETFPKGLNLKGVKLAIDTANGAAYHVAPHVFSELGADVEVFYNTPNGLNINEGCGALHPEKISDIVKSNGFDMGIALDGDADRVILVDEKGRIVDGDGILYIAARHLNSKGNLGCSSVVGTIMSNYGLEEALAREGIRLVRTDVGDNNVVACMREMGINLGGEPSGHLIFLHHAPTGDGILAALRVLSVMRQNDVPLADLLEGYIPYPQKTINVAVAKKVPFEEVEDIIKVKRLMDGRLKGIGRSVLRYSGTEPVARVTVEARDKELCDMLARELASVVGKKLGVNNELSG